MSSLNFGPLAHLLKEDPETDEFKEYQAEIEGLECVDLTDELLELQALDRELASLGVAITNIGRAKDHIAANGCTSNHVLLLAPELQGIGIDLEVGKTEDAVAALEAVEDKGRLEKFKELLLKVVDAIVRMIQKFIDVNKQDTNTIKQLLDTTLANIDKVDKEKFTNVVATAYEHRTFMELTTKLSKVDLLREVTPREGTLEDATSTWLKELYAAAGWEVKGDSIERGATATLKRGKMKELGYEPGNLKEAAARCKVALEHLRTHGQTVVTEDKKAIKVLKDDEKSRALTRQMLNHHMKHVAAIERISLICSKMIIHIVQQLQEKKS